MVLALVVGTIVLAILYAIYTFYIVPKKLCQHYAKVLTSQGFKVIHYPFKTFGSPIQEQLIRDQKEHQDYGYSTKHTFAEVDFVVTNILSYPMVISCNWEFVKKIFSVETNSMLPKNMLGFYLLKSLAPQSIVFLEGEPWKNKRKHITKVMSFDFLKAQIPLIVEMCNQIFNKVEERDRVKE